MLRIYKNKKYKKMSHTLYSWHGNPRGDIVRIAAEHAGVDAKFVNTPYAEL